ncbi:DUF2254 family protein [Altericroceibacterium endophyticum]|uniref:DUF2254 domain-containing protein n=1 Tax=Altericroceibacterium endophyticum TaxID=1808508 RepID=A0A6I4T8N2_9SPHN|nr:DUF2254 family protein [Altericroceibacterium endophyticum]MXO66622.1 DUF2254 domain-containing protein [Altericroceibacterium endophyticum]
MRREAQFGGAAFWTLRQLIINYWALPLIAVIAAPVAAIVSLWLGQHGASEFLLARDLAPVASAETAKELASTATGVTAAFLTLYFSITLLVLTLAAGNLGVRLIDRWIDKRLVRISMAGLAFCLVFSLIILAAIDPAADMADVPLFSLLVLIILQMINIAMMGVSLHDLGRTMFVDRSIARIGRDAATPNLPVTAGEAWRGEWAQTIPARRTGYVEGINYAWLAKKLSDHPGRLHFCKAPGAHVLEGEALVLCERDGVDPHYIDKAIAIGDFRSDGQGPVFFIRLLVEIAARALSPGINDSYTARAACDALTHAMAGQLGSWVDRADQPLYADDCRFEIPGQDFAALFAGPLATLRQSAADYPAIAARMIDNFGRLLHHDAMMNRSPELRAFLCTQADALADHALAQTQQHLDRETLESARRNCVGEAA